MKLKELENRTKQDAIIYIYINAKDNDKIWSVLYEDFMNNESDFADIYKLDSSKQKNYVSIVQIETTLKEGRENEYNYIEYFSTFNDAQKWAIETLQAKASLNIN